MVYGTVMVCMVRTAQFIDKNKFHYVKFHYILWNLWNLWNLI